MLDWVGIDVKAPPTDAVLYERVTGRTHAALHFLEAFRMLQKAGIPFECRTTAHPDYLPNTKLLELAVWLKSERVDTSPYRSIVGQEGSLQHCQLLEVTIRMNWLFQRLKGL